VTVIRPVIIEEPNTDEDEFLFFAVADKSDGKRKNGRKGKSEREVKKAKRV
jgi:hypothetical protein